MKYFYLSLVLLMSFISQNGYGLLNVTTGGSDSGGGDNFSPDEGIAWFMGGEKTIQYCVEIDEKFGVSREDAVKKIEWAFGKWGEYLRAKHFSVTLPQSILEFTTKVNYSTTCSANTDLVFYLGRENEAVAEGKKFYSNPSAFARRTRMDLAKNWGQGFIWVANSGTVFPKEDFPKWSRPSLLEVMLLHEIGHVLGCEHVSGTVMDREISAWLRAGQNMANGLSEWLKIDWLQELAMCFDCTGGAKAELSSSEEYPAGQTFQRLVGRPALGKIIVSIQRTFISTNVYLYTLRIQDDQGGEDFKLEIAKGGGLFVGDTSAFKVYVKTDQFQMVGGTPHFGLASIGTLKTKTNETFTLLFLQNAYSLSGLSGFLSGAGISYLYQGKMWPLFEAKGLLNQNLNTIDSIVKAAKQ